MKGERRKNLYCLCGGFVVSVSIRKKTGQAKLVVENSNETKATYDLSMLNYGGRVEKVKLVDDGLCLTFSNERKQTILLAPIIKSFELYLKEKEKLKELFFEEQMKDWGEYEILPL